MKFTKMHGIGNDYVYINAIEERIDNPSELAIAVSDRHFGIGSDGLILIKASDKADFMMDMYNADGSQGKMCGNGIRCVGKYVYDHGMTDKKIVTIETLSGIKTLNLTTKRVEETPGYQGVDNNGKVVCAATVNMGSPIFEPDKVPLIPAEGYAPAKLKNLLDINPVKDVGMDAEERIAYRMPIIINGRGDLPSNVETYYNGTCISMGNPHCVVFIDDTDNFPIEKVGPIFEKNSIFPEGVNTEFVQVIDRTHLKMRVWERGSGETLACGTGACATAVAAILNDFADDEVTVSLLGGDLKIRWDRQENLVFMTGPATTVFEGEYTSLEYK